MSLRVGLEPLSQRLRPLTAPLTGEPLSAPHKFPLKGEGFLYRTFNLPPCHCEPVFTLAWQSVLLAEGYDFPLHSRSCWAAKPPLCKGRWRGAPEGLMQRRWSSCATPDYSTSPNPAVPSREPHTKSTRWGTIPQSAKLTAPFTQRGLWCGAPPQIRWKIANLSHWGADCHTSDIGHWFAMTR